MSVAKPTTVALSDSCSLSVVNDILCEEAMGEGSLIGALEEIQARFRYLPPEALILASEYFNVPLAQTYAVATFYNAFSLKPKGKHCLHVCMGTACHVRGSPQVLDRLETKLDIKIWRDHAGPLIHPRNGQLPGRMCIRPHNRYR